MKQLSIFILILSSVSLFADAACTRCGGGCGGAGQSYTAPGGVKTCVPCAGGYYQNLANHWSTCNQCAAACSGGTTETTACTATTNRVCSSPQNTCSCSNGAAATGAACTSNGANICTSCSSGYYKNGNTCTGCRSGCGAGTRETTACSSAANRVCTSNTCSCSNGVKATGTACTSNSANICASCNTGYDKTGNTCTVRSRSTPSTPNDIVISGSSVQPDLMGKYVLTKPDLNGKPNYKFTNVSIIFFLFLFCKYFTDTFFSF